MDNLGRALGCIEPLEKLGLSQVASSSSLESSMDSLGPSLGCILRDLKVDQLKQEFF